MPWSRSTFDESWAIVKDRQEGSIDWMNQL